jgi:NitT/TauT family transport system substrate-binding protein
MLNDDPEQAAQVLADEAGGDAEADALLKQITADDVTFTNTPVGFGEIASFMKEIDMIGDEPSSDDMFFANDYTDGAS